MDITNLRQAVVNLNCALELESKVVGIKFLFTEEDFNQADAKHITSKMNYCVMVKLATIGRSLKANGDDLACEAGARALGLKPIDDYNKSGQSGKKLGLYNDMTTSKSARDEMSYCDHKAYGIMVKPLEQYKDNPDVIIIITNPYNAMRIIQGYSYFNGVHSTFKMSGNQAICSESTAVPYLSNGINTSLLCIGTRHKAGWKDNELSVSFPFNSFLKITEGVMNTINIMDSNAKKEIIEKKFHENGIDNFHIKYNFNYYNISIK